MKYLKLTILFLLSLQILLFAEDDKEENKSPWQSSTFCGLKFRNIGPAFPSGRIADFAVNPNNHSEYYVGVACGNIWKTNNSGTTWKPIFENYGSYSIGALKTSARYRTKLSPSKLSITVGSVSIKGAATCITLVTASPSEAFCAFAIVEE